MQAIVLLSGGIDSMACIHFYLNQGYSIEALFCDYGQPASVREMESAMTMLGIGLTSLAISSLSKKENN